MELYRYFRFHLYCNKHVCKHQGNDRCDKQYRQKPFGGCATVNASNELSSCGSKATNIAYWIRSTSYMNVMRQYILSSRMHRVRGLQSANLNTRRLARSVQTDNTPYFATMLDCVFGADSSTPADLGVNYRFGCISSSGNLTWQTGTNCGTSKLRLVKIGFIVQSSIKARCSKYNANNPF